VLVANQRELLALIDSVEQDVSLGIEVTRNIGPRTVQQAFYDEAIRLLHNYLAALKTLVEHTRNLMRDYRRSAFAVEYQRLVKVATASGLVPFMQKLRDYLLHYQIPPVGTRVEVDNRTGTAKVTVYLNRDAALAFRDWPPAARSFLTGQPDFIPLRDLIVGYEAEIEQLYRWLYPLFEELHGEQIRDVNALIAEVHGSVPPT
jgi:hypothetical protein